MALDFEIIKTDDPKKLIISDSSDWTGLGVAQIEILLPDCLTPEVLTFNKNIINTFYFADLALTVEELPDGMYTINLKDFETTVNLSKDYLRTANLRLEIDKLYLKCFNKYDFISEYFVESISNINLYLEAAYANVRNGDTKRAVSFYLKIRDKVDSFLRCNTCE